MTSSTQLGGASTASGVLYQLLWSLLRVLRLRLLLQDDFIESSDAILLLEPAGGGGDLQVAGLETTTVEQLKSKSDGGTWSLQTIIAEVLPDLFLATTLGGSRRYRFITEGKMGRWSDVYHFFQRLNAAEPPAAVLQALDDSRVLPFQSTRRKDADGVPLPSFFPEARYTERSLFLFIANHLCKRAAIANLNDRARFWGAPVAGN